MNKLIVCNTYYQLLLAIQMKNTNQSDYITFFLSDASKQAEAVVKSLNKYNVFDECYSVKFLEQGARRRNRFQKLFFSIKTGLFSNNDYLKEMPCLIEKKYDEIVSFNFGLEIDSYFCYLSKFNRNLKVSLMEEGIISYTEVTNDFIKRKIIGKIRHFKHQKSVLESMRRFYCYYPCLYKGNLKPVYVPKIEFNSKTSNDLKNIFELEDKLNGYTQKYIFFTSVYDFEGGKPVGEYELVCKIADLVGKDNLLVKTHPRDTRTIYTDNGFNVDKNSSIPWEAIQLSGDFSDKVFMTVNSGSVLSGSTMSEKPVKTFYMYKLCDISGNESCKKNAHDIEALLQNDEMKDVLRTVHIAEKIEDILG